MQKGLTKKDVQSILNTFLFNTRRYEVNILHNVQSINAKKVKCNCIEILEVDE